MRAPWDQVDRRLMSFCRLWTSEGLSMKSQIFTSFANALNWSRRWDLPLNTSKSHHLSIGGHPDLRLFLSKEANIEQMTKCEQINDLGITVNSAFTPSANVLTAAVLTY